MSSPESHEQEIGFGNRALLDKIDKLRELGVAPLVPLPQVSLSRGPGEPRLTPLV